MKQIIPPPERENIEKEIHHLFTNGDLTDIARLLQKDLSLVSRAFSPFSDEKHNPVYQFMLHLWAFDAIRPDLAGEVLNIVLREREKWLPAHIKRECAAKLTGNISTEFGEFIEAELSGKSFDKQIHEIMDVINAAQAKKESIIAKKNAEHFGYAS